MKRAFLLKHEIREVFFTQKIALKERFPGSSCEGLCPRNCCQFQPNIIYTCTLSTNSLHHAQLLWAPTRHLQRNLRSWLVGDPLCNYKHFIYTTPTIFPQSVYKYFQQNIYVLSNFYWSPMMTFLCFSLVAGPARPRPWKCQCDLLWRSCASDIHMRGELRFFGARRNHFTRSELRMSKEEVKLLFQACKRCSMYRLLCSV